MKQDKNVDISIINNAQIINELLSQISKDFSGLISYEADEIRDLSFQGMVSHLTPKIEFMMSENYEGFLQGLYRMDVQESRHNLAFQSNKPANRLGELIIKRALQKVVLKRYFSR